MQPFREELEKVIRGEVRFDDYTLGIYATDASIYQIMPVALVLPVDDQDVVRAVEIARKHRVSILPRGAGTSLGGQAAGASMIIDFSRYMNRILEVNLRERWARVQPGVILDELNARLVDHGMHFAPDPATGNRATIGGMIGNNSSGTKSILYGLTNDHILETRALLSDGTRIRLGEVRIREYLDKLAGAGGREYQLLSGFYKIIEQNRDEIIHRYPSILRRVQGYNLDRFAGKERWKLSDLIAGSEGTLGLVLEARIRLEPLPRHKILCTLHFSNLREAIGSVTSILGHQPSALEIMDEEVLRLARENLSLAPLCSFIKGHPEGMLLVEFFGDSPGETQEKAEALVSEMKKQRKGYHWPCFTDPEEQARVWEVRKKGLGLMSGVRGDRKPIAFIEDAAVPVEVLAEYVEQVLAFCRKRDVCVEMYAHAGVGEIHLRPLLDLKKQEDIDHMKAIAEHSFSLVRRYGGSISGEHGDGRVRSPFLERYFGPSVYQAHRDVKQLFDPAGIMNPGVIVDPAPMDHNLRFGSGYITPDLKTHYHYRDSGGFAGAVEMCTGVGDCRQALKGLMCPSFRATRDEEHSTRGRANALRLAMTGQLGEEGISSEGLYRIMDLCLSCKGCKAECPSNVDVARLKGEFLQSYYESHGTRLRDRLVAGSTKLASRMAGWKAPLVNRIQGSHAFRRIMEWIAGVDRRRTLPFYAKRSFHRWFNHRHRVNRQGAMEVVLFDDTYMNFHETEVGVSAVELLESCGYNVTLARAGCCQRPKISHGFLKKAKADGEKTLKNLEPYIDRGLPIVVCEPGCASALTDDLPDLVDDEALGKKIRENVKMIDVFLDQEIKAGNIQNTFSSAFEKILIHGHCHQKSLYGTDAMYSILEGIPGVSVEVVDSGCCGMAGSFGYEREHYELSMKIGEDRLFPALRKKDNYTAVVACGFSCRHQIKHGTGIRAMHWVEVLRGKAKK